MGNATGGTSSSAFSFPTTTKAASNSGNAVFQPQATAAPTQDSSGAFSPPFDPSSILQMMQQQQQQSSTPQQPSTVTDTTISTLKEQLRLLQTIQQQQQQAGPPPVQQPSSNIGMTFTDFQRILTEALQGSGSFPNNESNLAQAAASGISQMLLSGNGSVSTTTPSPFGDLSSSLRDMLQAAQQQQQQQSQQQIQPQVPQGSQLSSNPFMAWATVAAAATGSPAPTLPDMSWQQNPATTASSTGTMNPQATSDLLAAITEHTDSPSAKRQKRPYHHESFPAKLHRLLAETEAAEQDDIVSFNAEGTVILIHQPEAFEEEIIPRYFRHSKLSSFKRQLSMYGFTRILEGPDAGGFTHPLFRKGRPDLSKDMERVS
eukprot:scaffold17644_cov170-Amphora_coffeaeformis.AAC.4